MRHVALATAAQVPDLDEDGTSLRRALAARDIAAVPAVWDDATVDWGSFDAVVIRSTWDYVPRRDAFISWGERVGACLHNRPEFVRWNTDKRYLRDLELDGVDIVPTTWVAPGERPALPPRGDFVVKPSISAGGTDTARYVAPGEHERACAHIARLNAAGRTAMIQPYVASVDARGETGLVFFGGAFSHATKKAAILRQGADPHSTLHFALSELYAPESIVPVSPTAAQRAAAERIIELASARFGTPLYARVDLVTGPRDVPWLIELELTEPSLFLGYSEGAAERFAAAIAAAL